MKDLKDELIEKQKELIAWLKCISIDITVLRTREKLESEIASLESQIKEKPKRHIEDRSHLIKINDGLDDDDILARVEQEKPIRIAEELDLMQYVTNLLYNAYADGKAKVESSTFDAFVEEQIELIVEYLNKFKVEAIDPTKDTTEILNEREALFQAFDKIRASFKGRHWLMEGRGCYPYDDERYKEEVRYIMDEFEEINTNLWKQIKSKSFEYRKSIEEPLQKRIAELEASQFKQVETKKEPKEWIDVKIQMPKGEVLLLTTSKRIVIGDRYGEIWRTNNTCWVENKLLPEYKDEDITHWMPLPIIERNCMEENCNKPATKDYNNHGHWVCDRHYDKLNDEFDEEYS